MATSTGRLAGLGVALALVVSALLTTTAGPAPAQPAELRAPVLNDGEWSGRLGATGPFDIGEMHGEVIYEGVFQLTVFQGSITAGTWSVSGEGVAAHPRVSGYVSYLASGVMGGLADLPEMLPEEAVAEYDLMVDNVPLAGSTEFGPGEMSSIAIPLLSATCDFVVGNWNLPANLVYQQAGGGSSIGGYWFASRVGGELSREDQAALDTAWAGLMRRAVAVADRVYQTGQVDSVALNALIGEAEWFNQRLMLNNQCGDRTLLGWVNPLGQTVLGLLDWALNNPDQFDDAELLGLIAAAVRTNVLGSRSPDNQMTLDIRGRLAEELPRRAERARGLDDCAAAAVLNAAATTLDDPNVRAATQGVMAEVCP